MLKTSVTFLLLFCFTQSKAQIGEKADSLATGICESLNQISSPIDSVTIIETFGQHLNKYLKKMKTNDQEQAINKIIIRLQTTCDIFVKYMKRYEIKGWTRVENCPKSNVSKSDLDKLFLKRNFYYIEPSGDTTMLEITNDSWVDHMKGGTYSKLSLKRLSPYDFVITFIECTNSIKKSMSKVGDKYYYSIVSKEKNSYELCTTIPTISGGTLFKIYLRN